VEEKYEERRYSILVIAPQEDIAEDEIVGNVSRKKENYMWICVCVCIYTFTNESWLDN